MRRFSAKLERWETAGEREASLRGVPSGVLDVVEMADEEAVELLAGLSKGDGRFRELSALDDEVGLDEEAAGMGCAIDTEGATGASVHVTEGVNGADEA